MKMSLEVIKGTFIDLSTSKNLFYQQSFSNMGFTLYHPQSHCAKTSVNSLLYKVWGMKHVLQIQMVSRPTYKRPLCTVATQVQTVCVILLSLSRIWFCKFNLLNFLTPLYPDSFTAFKRGTTSHYISRGYKVLYKLELNNS